MTACARLATARTMRTSIDLPLLPLLFALAGACGDKAAEPASSGAASAKPPTSARAQGAASASSAAVDKPAGLSEALLKKVILEIDVYAPNGDHNPTAAVLAQAKAKLGEPTFVGKNKTAWGVVTAELCASLEIEDKDGKAYTDGVVSAENNGHNAAYDACLVTLGKAPAAASSASASATPSSAPSAKAP